MDEPTLTQRLKQAALKVGFDQVAVCPAVQPPGYDRLSTWLDRGYAGEMHYIADRQSAYADPSSVLAGARSLVMLTMNYRAASGRYESETPAARFTPPGYGKIAQYAWGTGDYHDVIHHRMREILRWLTKECPPHVARGVVDTAPLMERQFAQLAGLGWQAKNTLLISPAAGSLFFLAAIVTDLALDCDQPFTADHCGTCTACLDACPTDAFPEPYVLDATRCISYLTIEHRGSVPMEFRNRLDGWLFGCDVCQDVCPWNSKSQPTSRLEFEPNPDNDPVALCQLFALDDSQFRDRFRRTPLWRAKRVGILRNAALLLGAAKYRPAESVLIAALADPSETVRAAVVWGLGQLATSTARRAIEAHRPHEQSPDVLSEILALADDDMWHGG